MTISSKWHGVDLNDDQLTVLDWLREFCEKEIRPNASKYDKSQETPWEVIHKAAAAGIYSIDFFGQLFFGDPTGKVAALAIEELFFADPGIALALFGTGLPAAAIMANGTNEQKGKWLPRCFVDSKGKPALAAFCSSESGAGSDVSGMRTRAVYNAKKKTWTINGTKDWITNGAIANEAGEITGVHVVVAVVDPKLGARGQASFIVPPGTRGLSQGVKHHKLGFRASHTAEVVFDNVGEGVMEKSMKALAYNGRYVMMGFASDKKFADEKLIVPRRVIAGNMKLCGALLAYAEAPVAAMMKKAMGWNFCSRDLGVEITRQVVELVQAGKVRPVIGQVVPFEEIPAALTRMRDRQTIGRTVARLD